MPNSSKNDIILVRYPFSDLSGAKVRPAVVVSATLTDFNVHCGSGWDFPSTEDLKGHPGHDFLKALRKHS